MCFLVATLEYLASNLQHPELSDAAAQSMYGICHEAKEKLRDLFAPLSNILKNLHSYKLSNKSAIAVIKGNYSFPIFSTWKNVYFV